MANAFTVYWGAKGWQGYGPGDPLRGAGGSGFLGKLNPGDRVYATNITGGVLRLLGAFTVGRVTRASEGRPPGVTWEAKEYLWPEVDTATGFAFRALPLELVSSLRFEGGADRVAMDLHAPGQVERNAMREVRRLSLASARVLEQALGTAAVGPGIPGDRRSGERLPADLLKKATPDLIFTSVAALLDGAPHGFGESTDYDLITDEGERLPPKAVVGLALSRALDREILPKHFSAGENSVCFRLLREAGYRIVPKGETPPAGAETDLDRDATPPEVYPEGAKVLKQHFDRERRPAAARAKKVPCPLCGTPVEQQVDPADLRPRTPKKYRDAIAAEVEKIRDLRRGLLQSLGHEDERIAAESSEVQRLSASLASLEREEAQILRTAAKEFDADPRQLAESHTRLSSWLGAFDEVERLTQEIERLKKAKKQKKTPLTRNAGTNGDEVGKYAREMLVAWGFTSIQFVQVDAEACDLVIDGRRRLSYGAGKRGLFRTALTIALMRHALKMGNPHLGAVVLDSPLKAYAQKESTDTDRDVPLVTVKESFYVWLSQWSGPGQIVVLENEPVDSAVAPVLQATEFTDSFAEGRQGFYPPRPGMESSPRLPILDDGDENVEDGE